MSSHDDMLRVVIGHPHRVRDFHQHPVNRHLKVIRAEAPLVGYRLRADQIVLLDRWEEWVFDAGHTYRDNFARWVVDLARKLGPNEHLPPELGRHYDWGAALFEADRQAKLDELAEKEEVPVDIDKYVDWRKEYMMDFEPPKRCEHHDEDGARCTEEAGHRGEGVGARSGHRYLGPDGEVQTDDVCRCDQCVDARLQENIERNRRLAARRDLSRPVF